MFSATVSVGLDAQLDALPIGYRIEMGGSIEESAKGENAIKAVVVLTRQVFWGPMAVSIMGCLVIATLLTCLALPALYAAWYRVREN